MPLSAPVIPHRGTESIWAPICPARLPREPQRGKGGGDVNGRGLWGSRRPLWAGGLWGGTRGARGVVPVTPKTLGSLGAGGGSVGWFPRTPSAGGVYGVAPQNPGTPGVGGVYGVAARTLEPLGLGGLWGGPWTSSFPLEPRAYGEAPTATKTPGEGGRKWARLPLSGGGRWHPDAWAPPVPQRGGEWGWGQTQTLGTPNAWVPQTPGSHPPVQGLWSPQPCGSSSASSSSSQVGTEGGGGAFGGEVGTQKGWWVLGEMDRGAPHGSGGPCWTGSPLGSAGGGGCQLWGPCCPWQVLP